MFALGFIYLYFRHFDFDVVFSLAPFFYKYFIFNVFNLNISALDVICILFFIGTIGKSAQLGLHV